MPAADIHLPRGFEGFAREILRGHEFTMSSGYRHTHGGEDSDEDDSDYYTDSEEDSDDSAGDGFCPSHYAQYPRSVPVQDLINEPYYGGSSHTRRMSHEAERREQSEAFKSSRAQARQRARAKVQSENPTALTNPT